MPTLTIRNVPPKTVRSRIAQIEQLIKIGKLIEDNCALQTPLVDTVLAGCVEGTKSLLEILKKLDADASAARVVKYWKALEGITKESNSFSSFVLSCAFVPSWLFIFFHPFAARIARVITFSNNGIL